MPEEDEDIEEEEAETLNEQLENDYELGCVIKDKVHHIRVRRCVLLEQVLVLPSK